MEFLKRLFNPNPIGIEGVSFDTMDWPEFERKKQYIYWRSEEFPAQLSLHYFPQAPDLPGELENANKLQQFYREKLRKPGGGIVDIARIRIQSYLAISTLFKMPMENGGLMYVGSYTLPFARYGYVVKVQAQEYQELGYRERLVQEKLQKSGQLRQDASGEWENWERDPYDPDYRFGTLMNQAEEIKHDLFFPAHPLTRVREAMFRIRNSLVFEESLSKLDPYPNT